MDQDTRKVCTTYLKDIYFVYVIMLGIDRKRRQKIVKMVPVHLC